MTGFEYAQIQASGHSRPPNTSDSRQSVRIASNCGWCRLCAIFSGRMCTIQKSAMSTTGTTKRTKSAMNVASLSSASGDRNDACASVGASEDQGKREEDDTPNRQERASTFDFRWGDSALLP